MTTPRQLVGPVRSSFPSLIYFFKYDQNIRKRTDLMRCMWKASRKEWEIDQFSINRRMTNVTLDATQRPLTSIFSTTRDVLFVSFRSLHA